MKALFVYIAVLIFTLCDYHALAQEPASPDSLSQYANAGELPEDNPRIQDTFYMRMVPDSIITDLKRQRTFAYANDPAYWIKQPYEPSVFEKFFFYLITHAWVKWIFYGLLGFLLGYALFRILKTTQLNLFFTPRKKRSETAGEELAAKNWTEELAIAEAAGDFRTAIRFQFLQTLQVLDEKGILAYHPESTNQDYLLQIKGHECFNLFSQLTRIYEYAWYGDFRITEPLYRQAAALFKSFQVSIS